MWRRLMTTLVSRLHRRVLKPPKNKSEWSLRLIGIGRILPGKNDPKGLSPTLTYGGRKRRGNVILLCPLVLLPLSVVFLHAIELSFLTWPQYPNRMYFSEGELEQMEAEEEEEEDEDEVKPCDQEKPEKEPLFAYQHPHRYIPPSQRRRVVVHEEKEEKEETENGNENQEEDECENESPDESRHDQSEHVCPSQ